MNRSAARRRAIYGLLTFMRDLEPGEPVILVNHIHQPAQTPYRLPSGALRETRLLRGPHRQGLMHER